MNIIYRTAWLRFGLLAVALAALLFAFAPMPRAHAGRPGGPAIIVRNDGATFPVQASSDTFSPSHRPLAEGYGLVNRQVALNNFPPMRGLNPESVIGTDDRKRVKNTTTYPYGAIAQFEMTFPSLNEFICTGWFIGPETLATAAHCVYDGGEGGWATAITVFPGRNGSTAPFGTFAATHWYAVQDWVDTANPKFDYAAVQIDTDLSSQVGYFGFGYNSNDSFLLNRAITVSGYPGDKKYGTQWKMSGPIQSVNKTRFFYSIDTAGGQSGSPAYGKWGTSCDPCGFGIHTYGVGGSWTRNSATRITRKVFNFLDSLN